jgi:sigma-E factor negative regulatory protein RseC
MKNSAENITVQHDGVVKEVDGNSVQVSIISHPACKGCHAEGLCGITGNQEKIIEVKGIYNVSPGDPVTILMEQSTGFKAVFLSYVIPLVIILAGLFIGIALTESELTAGLISITLLLPYFFILYLFRRKINSSFTFTLKT